MIVWTVRLCAYVCLSACMHLVVHWMILLFFPPMRIFASIFELASISICLYKVLCLPTWTLFLLILEYVWFPPEVLPVVSIHTCISSMLSITIWTPYSFEMKHVKVRILLKFVRVQEVYSHLFKSVSECTHVAIVTRVNTIWVGLTEFNLVLFWMIEFLHPIMRLGAVVSIRALVVSRAILNVWAYLTSVGTQWSSPVFLGFMIEETFFRIVLILQIALLSLELAEINEYHYIILLFLISQVLLRVEHTRHATLIFLT